jgi:OOP family OmpA-OmpF porin
MNGKIVLLAAALGAIPAVVQAQDVYTPYEGFYIGAGGGALWSLNNGSSGVSTSTGWLVGGKLGYDFIGPRVDLEVGYGRIPSNAFVPGTVLSGGGGQLNVMANVYYDFMPRERLTPYIGAGAGIAFVDSNQSLGSTQFAYQGMLGVLYHIDNNWTFGIEGRYTATTNPSFTVGGTTITYQNQNIAALAGIAYKFAPAAAAPPPPPPPMVAPPSFMVFFDWDRSNLSQQALNTIGQAAQAYKTKGNARVTATGHTDTSGSDAYNMALSLRRANTVKDALVQNGVPATAISVVGRGEAGLLVQTGDNVREPQNRRVEIVIQ